jgi:hypothetical protein
MNRRRSLHLHHRGINEQCAGTIAALQVGHIVSNCTKPKRERGFCYECGKMGHVAAKCTNKKMNENRIGAESTNLIDEQEAVLPPDMTEVELVMNNG